MNILQDIVQGTDSWHRVRAQHFTASEASAMMGESKFMSRNELLKQKQSGYVPEVDSAKQYLFDKGHAAEAAARPIVEEILGDELYPCTGTAVIDGLPLLASFDGLTMDESIAWECKLLNQDLVAMVEQGDLGNYCWQLEQQLLVSGADKVYFTTSDGTPNGTHGCWYKSDPVKRAKLIAGWHQFSEDLKNYVHVEKATPVVAHVESLPAVSVRLNGELAVASNLPEFGVALKDFISRIPTKPSTDQEFADCDSACKSLKKAEDALDAAENNAIAQMTDFESMRRAVADLRESARTTRLACEKMVKARKETVKMEIITEARQKLDQHISKLNARVSGMMPKINGDFFEAAKGKRNIDSLRNAVDTTLAQAKIEANEIADRIRANLETPGLHGYEFLFADLAIICTKANEDFVNTVTARITMHEAKEAERVKAETARIAEQERIKAEAKLEAERESIRKEAVAKAQAERPTEAPKVVETREWTKPDADGVITRFAPPRKSTRAMVDNMLDGMSESALREVLEYLQYNFARLSA